MITEATWSNTSQYACAVSRPLTIVATLMLSLSALKAAA